MRHCFSFLAFLLAAAYLLSCSDNESFSASRNNLLTFSEDTCRMDTVWGGIGSSTHTFWVYNRSGNGIRISSVRLLNGNQTGFRANVDGIELNAVAGYQTSDLEVRRGDSLRVFIEITATANKLSLYKSIEEKLIFQLESGVRQEVVLTATSADAYHVHDLHVASDSAITADKPLIVFGGLTVDSTATLTLQAGAQLFFHDKAGMDVYGTLKVEGTAEHPVVLRGDRLDRMFDYLPYDAVSGQWRGLRFHPSSYNNVISFADIHAACDGIVCDSSAMEQKKLTVRNTILHNHKGYGLLTYQAAVELENCQITNALYDCACFYGGQVDIRYCTFAQFYPFDANRGVAFRFSNAYEGKPYPLLRMSVQNSIITGYGSDELMGHGDSICIFSYAFADCLLRTPPVSDSLMVRVLFEQKDSVANGEANFVKVNLSMQSYDFHLDSASRARDAAMPLPVVDIDLRGRLRGEKPDMGCYEYVAPTE